jgi:hypothetical protein
MAGLIAVCGAKPSAALERPALEAAGGPEPAAEVAVQLRKGDAGWELVRGGRPYFVRGAGGEGYRGLRTWGGNLTLS